MSRRQIGNPGAHMWARTDLRRRWLSLIVLGILAGSAAGLAMASLAGARRTETAFPRLKATTHAADAVVFPGQVGGFVTDWAKLRARPYVESVAPWSLLFGAVNGQPGGLLFGPIDGTWLQQVDRPVVVRGRMWDPKRPDEVVEDEDAATQLPLGSTFTFRFYANGKSDLDGIPPNGPSRRLKVVGIIRETSEFLFAPGLIIPSPALLEQDRAHLTHIENAHVRLKDPAKDMALLKRDVPTLLQRGTPVLDLHQVVTRVSTAISVERSALLLLSAAVAAAGLVFVGQALSRSVATIDADADALRAMGFARRDISFAATAPHVLVAVVGAIASFAIAVALSPRFPIGFSGRVDPNRGFHADWTVLAPGVALTPLLIVLGALSSSWLRERRATQEPPVRTGTLSRLRRVVPTAVGLGAMMAFDGGHGRRAVPVRPALIGAIVAVLGVAGTLTIGHGLDEAVANPSRVGVTWDATVSPPFTDYDPHTTSHLASAATRNLTTDAALTDVSVFWRAVVAVDGVGVPTFASAPMRGDIEMVVVNGRPPVGEDEVALGPATARQLHVDVGGLVHANGRTLRVVGRSLFPVDVHSGFDEGMWALLPTLRAIAPPTNAKTGGGPSPTYMVRWAKGTGSDAGVAALKKRFPDAQDISPAQIPPELTNLRNVRTVPAVLAAFLVLLGLASMVHALVASVRARRRDLAVLRAIGFTRWMNAEVVVVQSSVVAMVGLIVGIPVGSAIGRAGWSWVSARIPMVFASPLWLQLVLVIVPLTLVAALAIAAWPARRAGRLQPAKVLHGE